MAISCLRQLAAVDPLGLLADDSEDPLIARRRRKNGQNLVQGFRHHGRGLLSANAPGDGFVDEIGRGYFPDVGLTANTLAEVRVRPHRLACSIGQFQRDSREHVV